MKDKKKISTKTIIIIVLVLFILCVACAIVTTLFPTTTETVASPTNSEEAVVVAPPTEIPPTVEPTAAPEPTSLPELSPEERVESSIRDALGDLNRDGERINKISIADGKIYVKWAINDNLTEGFIKRGVMMDIVDILQAVSNSGYPYTLVTVEGTFPMVDTYGNTSEDNVVMADYSKETVDQINWDGFLTENVYDIAGLFWLHPAFQ